MNPTRSMTPSTCLLILFCLFLGFGCAADNEKKKERFLASGEDYFEQEKYPEAMIQFKNVVQLDPRSAVGYYRLGLTHLKLGKIGDAFQAFRKSVEIDPQFPNAQVQLGNLYLLSKKPEEAKQCAEKAIAVDVDGWKAWVLLANASVLLQDLPEARTALKTAIALAPDEILPQLLMAKYHQLEGNSEAAEEAYLEARTEVPGFAAGRNRTPRLLRKDRPEGETPRTGGQECFAVPAGSGTPEGHGQGLSRTGHGRRSRLCAQEGFGRGSERREAPSAPWRYLPERGKTTSGKGGIREGGGRFRMII